MKTLRFVDGWNNIVNVPSVSFWHVWGYSMEIAGNIKSYKGQTSSSVNPPCPILYKG